MVNFSFFNKNNEPEIFSLNSIAGDSVESTVSNWRKKQRRFVYPTEIPLIILTVVSHSPDVTWQHAALRKLGLNLPEPNQASNERPFSRRGCLQGWKRIIGIFLESNFPLFLKLFRGIPTARKARPKKQINEQSLEVLSGELDNMHQSDAQELNKQLHDLPHRLSISNYARQIEIENQMEKFRQFTEFLSMWQSQLASLASEITLTSNDYEILKKVEAMYRTLYDNYSSQVYNLPVGGILAFDPETVLPYLIAPLDPGFYESILLSIQSILIAEDSKKPHQDGITLEIRLFQNDTQLRNFFRVMIYYTIAYFAQYLITQLWLALRGGDSVLKDPERVRRIGECLGVLQKSTSRIKLEIDSGYGVDLQVLFSGVLSHVCESKCEKDLWRGYNDGVFGIFTYFQLLLQYFPGNEGKMTNSVC